MRARPWLACGLLASTLACSRPDTTVDNLAAAQEALARGDLARAMSALDQVSATARSGSLESWSERLLRGEVLLERGDTTAARDLLRNAPPSTAPPAIVLRHAYLSAKTDRDQGRLKEALVGLSNAALGVAENDPIRLPLDLLAGQIHLRLGHWEDGDAVLRVVAERAASAGDRAQEAMAFLDLGMSRVVRGRYDEALVWFEQVLAFSDLEQYVVYRKGLSNAGICYSRLGLFDRALHVQQRAVEIQKRSGPSRERVDLLGNLGVTYGLQDQHREALEYFEQAFAAAQEVKLSSEASLWAGNIASAHARLGNWDEAERANRQSEAFADGKQSSPYHLLNDAQIAVGRGQLDVAKGLFEQVRSGATAPTLQWTSEVGLAKVALQAGHGPEANRHFETALGVLDRTRLDLARTDYRLSFLTQLIEFYQDYVDALVGQGRSDRALEIADSSRGRVLAERQRVAAPARVTAAMFQRVAARTRTTLLSYWLAPKRSFLWVITASGIRRVDLPSAPDIEAAVREYRALVDNSMANPLDKAGTAGDRLYQLLVAPAKIPRGASVVIVPDGALHGINLETLPVDGPSRHYWIEDVQVQVAPSLAMLTVDTGKAPSDGHLLLIGNPTPRAPDFPALSYAPGEMTGIVRHFPRERVTSYDSAKATPAVYQEASLDRFSMIHFTAHAVANVESPLDSAVVLSGPDTAYKLYARDVADRPLKADLVTVSACRSAGERAYSGEGLVGFAWAFLRAGARRVVAGLWDVDDRSTAQLMSTLYGGIAKGHTPAAALRAAKLELIAQGGQLARPYYWGPFQLFTVTP